MANLPKTSGILAIGAVALNIISALGFFPGLIAWIIGAGAFVFSLVVFLQNKDNKDARLGFMISFLALVLVIAQLGALWYFVSNSPDTFFAS